jgi:mono/diheme cytochrome c family protein
MARKTGASQVTGQAPLAWRGAIFVGCLAICGFSWAGLSAAQTADGKAVYVEANCVGCHKWHGQGGGGYGGAALSLRETALERADLIEVIRCGRPATGMPYHLRAAWNSTECYGMKAADIGTDMPPTAAKFLRDHQIEAVADYVIEHLKGHGAPTKEECVAFWGDDARECTRF